MNRQFKDAILFAYPLGGKDTQATFLMNFYQNSMQNFLYIATGDFFRKLDKNNHSACLLNELINKGNLAPDFIATGLVVNSLVHNLSKDKTLIFNGFPRNKKQGETLVELMNFYGRKPVLIIIKVSKEEIIRRLETNENRGDRQDDTEDIVTNRLLIFDKENDPLVDYLKQHFECYEVNGDGEPEKIHDRILEIL